jgi:hypothetical protein
LGEYPAGDPEIHHVVGSLFADGTWARHVTRGTQDWYRFN